MTTKARYDASELLASLEADCTQRLVQRLERAGLLTAPERQSLAVDFARALVDQLAHDWGGQQLYVPKRYQRNLLQRDTQIFKDFDGYNHKELADKYNLGIHAIYSIIKRQTEARRISQARLFD